MNKLKIFNHNEFGKIETIQLNGEIYFNARNVGKALGIKSAAVRMAITNFDEDEVRKLKNSDFTNKNSNVNLIDIRKLNNAGETFLTEAGVYALVFQSRKSNAKAFSKWVRKEVLPSIRKTGSYSAAIPDFSNPVIAARAWADQYEKNLLLGAVNKEMTVQLKEQKPKVTFFDIVANSKDAYPIGEVAAMLNLEDEKGKKIGQNTLFRILRSRQILKVNNLPYQRYLDNHYFNVVQKKRTDKDGNIYSYIQTMVNQKGIAAIGKMLIKLDFAIIKE